MYIKEEDYRSLMKIIEVEQKQIERLTCLYEGSREREKLLAKCYVNLFDFVDKNFHDFPETVKQQIEIIKSFNNVKES